MRDPIRTELEEKLLKTQQELTDRINNNPYEGQPDENRLAGPLGRGRNRIRNRSRRELLVYNMQSNTRIECTVTDEMKKKMGMTSNRLNSSFDTIARRYGPFLSRGVKLVKPGTNVKFNKVPMPANVKMWVPDGNGKQAELEEALTFYYKHLG